MRAFVLLLTFLAISIVVCSQKPDKPPLDFSAIEHFVSLGSGDGAVSISDDGMYISYIIDNLPFERNTLVVRALRGYWKKEFIGTSAGGFFSSDSKKYIFQARDTLFFWDLSSGRSTFIAGVDYYQKPGGVKDDWLSYRLKNSPSGLVLYNLTSSKSITCDGTTSYLVNSKKGLLLIHAIVAAAASYRNQVCYIDLRTGDTTTIWCTDRQGIDAKGFNFDSTGRKLVFLVQDTIAGQKMNSFWYYEIGMKQAVLKVDDRTPGIDSSLSVGDDPGFTEDGKYIVFSLVGRTQAALPKQDAAQVDVWSFTDTILQSTQLCQINRTKTFKAVLRTGNARVIRLLDEYETLRGISGDIAVVSKDATGDRFWEKDYGRAYSYIVSLVDGSRIKLPVRAKLTNFSFSPGNQFLVYCDGERECRYFSYCFRTNRLVDISIGVPLYMLGRTDEFRDSHRRPSFNNGNGVAGWMAGDAGVLVYDNYDVWLLDLNGRTKGRNLTKGYGRTHQIKLRLTCEEAVKGFSFEDTLLLTAFEPKTKFNGFYQLVLKEHNSVNPHQLFMGPFVFELSNPGNLPLNTENFNQGEGMAPLKAKDARVWIVKRMTFKNAPNYFVTDDFYHFVQVTDIEPMEGYNWLSAELVQFTQRDGVVSQGILYLPENFNPGRKYPVILNYYQQLSHRLFQYPAPEFMSSAHIDIPWFVSRGYLVFTLDIHYRDEKHRPESALDAVIGASRRLAMFSFVDPKKMGISGHSEAGGYTNFIVAHSHRFAAAIEGAGVSDYIADAFSLDGKNEFNEVSRLGPKENGGPSLWQDRPLWLSKSPILAASQITTPLLIFHNKADEGVPWQNGLALFIALRRLNKQAWMLQYDAGGHVLDNPSDLRDFTIRTTQFFDFYLKGLAEPAWMARGIPARLKGIENGYENESSAKANTALTPTARKKATAPTSRSSQ